MTREACSQYIRIVHYLYQCALSISRWGMPCYGYPLLLVFLVTLIQLKDPRTGLSTKGWKYWRSSRNTLAAQTILILGALLC